jgi:hypothetical protein
MVPDFSNLNVSNPAASVQIDVSNPTPGNRLDGTFDLTYGSHTASGIAYDASASDMKAALEGLSTIPSGTIAVTRTGPDGQLGYSWTISFLSDYLGSNEGNLDKLVADGSGLS